MQKQKLGHLEGHRAQNNLRQIFLIIGRLIEISYLILFYIYTLKGGDSMSIFFRMRGVERAPASGGENFFDVDGGLEQWWCIVTIFTLAVSQSKIVRALVLVLGSTVLVRFIMSNSQKKIAPFLLTYKCPKKKCPVVFITFSCPCAGLSAW